MFVNENEKHCGNGENENKLQLDIRFLKKAPKGVQYQRVIDDLPQPLVAIHRMKQA